MRGTLQGPLKALQRGEEPFGPLGARIRASAQHAAYARAMLDDLEGQLDRLGFQILDADDFASDERMRFCDLATEESLRNSVGPIMVNLERRIKDAHSVATILRLRGPAQCRSTIAETGWILITRNDTVADRSQNFLESRNLIGRDQVPPAITDRRFAGYLWFAVGGSIGTLSRKKLIANCSNVMTPRTDVVSKARQYLYELDPEKAEVFVALMRDQRAQRCLMHSTLGFPSAIRPENAEALLEQVRLSVAEEVQKKADEREKTIKAEHQAQISLISQERQLESIDNQSVQLKSQQMLEKERQDAAKAIRSRDEHIDALGGRLAALEEFVESDVDQRIQRATGSANRFTWLLKIALTTFYLSIVGSAYWFLPNQRVLFTLTVTLFVALLAFWIVPQFIYDRLAQPLWLWRLRSRCDDLGVAKQLVNYDIKAALGTVTLKTRGKTATD